MGTPNSEITSLNLPFAEELYQRYIENPFDVPADWRRFFQAAGGGEIGAFVAPPPVPDASPACGGRDLDRIVSYDPGRCRICGRQEQMSALQQRVDKLIRSYRERGHRTAMLDPLGRAAPRIPELDPAYHGLAEGDMDRKFSAGLLGGGRMISLREVIQRLQETYCRCIGVEFMHIDDMAVREWLQARMETTRNHIHLDADEQIRILTKLTEAVLMEEFIQQKFVGAKRFSLEGAESLIPLLDLAIEEAGRAGIKEIVIGMAHRGRLNVLANIMGKRPEIIFREFRDAEAETHMGGGDVKYHKGYHNDWITNSGHTVHLALCFNPSHLEYVNPVALGRTRAKQDRLGDADQSRYMTVLIHGDAAFAGEGIVQETLNLSQLEGYSTGGTLHIVVNNQIGFTTGPEESRSSVYATDVAKMLQVPIFHVNGEDPEAVAQVVSLAMEFRRTFRKDVVVDMYCYRKRGHNEGDEPAFTQPVMYRAIKQRKSVRDGYLDNLAALGEVTREQGDEIAARSREQLERELTQAQDAEPSAPPVGRPSILGRVWRLYKGGRDADLEEVDTGVDAPKLADLLRKLATVPEGFTPHPKIKRLLDQRIEMAEGERPLDWAAAEALAYASLAVEGAPVRLSGQDSRRGTFSHRHAVLYDYETGETFSPLQHVHPDQARVDVINSPLCEAGVLGYEYGYSCAYPDGLVLWEAQFGDFANCAQVIIDQDLTSAEDKWRSLSGIVLLLPHGFEGMGPEHSSARLERFLMLAAEDNIQVIYPSTPAQFFHALRRQVCRPWRKPLVVMTPKSLLRHPRVTSTLEDLAQGPFQRVIPDNDPKRGAVDRVLLCSGKIYYELLEEREKLERTDVAIVRVEQFYPLHDDTVAAALEPYPAETPVLWVQEEPLNMGAWPYLRMRYCTRLAGKWPLHGVTRAESASPATGSAASHQIEQRMIIDQAFGALADLA